MKKSSRTVPMLIRVPQDMKRQLEEEAKQQHRSLSAHVWVKLQTAMLREKSAKRGGKPE